MTTVPIVTESGKEITAANIYQYDRCLEKHLDIKSQPCRNCNIELVTACMRIRVSRERHGDKVS